MSAEKISLDVNYVKGLVQNILNNNHADKSKTRIRETPSELNFSCPICGDSAKRSSVKRGHLYFKNMMYICYNERESCSRSFLKLLSTFDVHVDLDKKLEIYQYIDQNVQFKKQDDVEITNLDKLFHIDELTEFYKSLKDRKITDLMPLQENSPVDYYIRNTRKIYNTADIYQANYHYTSTWSQPVIVFLNRMGEKVISMQVRNLLKGKKRYFKVLDFSYIYEQMNPETLLDEQEKISYDKLSHFFNIFNVDFTQTVNMFESYTDSLFIPNSIGQIGLNTDISFLLNEDVILRFIYDNDGPGFRKTTEMLKKGHTVFLWNKFLLHLLKKYKGNKFEFAKILTENIKDFNDLGIKFKKPIYNMFNWNDYFSNNIMDKLYLMDLSDLVKMNL